MGRDHPIFVPSSRHFVGLEAMTSFLHETVGTDATRNVDTLVKCRHDPDCKSIWSTDLSFLGVEVKVTEVLGYYNASDSGNRCHVLSTESEAWCHDPDPALTSTRGRAYLMMGVPTSDENAEPLPIAGMCYNFGGDDIHQWCHLISGNDFLAIPQDGFLRADGSRYSIAQEASRHQKETDSQRIPALFADWNYFNGSGQEEEDTQRIPALFSDWNYFNDSSQEKETQRIPALFSDWNYFNDSSTENTQRIPALFADWNYFNDSS